MIEVILTLGTLLAASGVYMLWPDGHRQLGVWLTAIGGILLLYGGLLAIGWWEPPTQTWKVFAGDTTERIPLDAPTTTPYTIQHLTTDWGARVRVVEKQSDHFMVQFDLPAPKGDGELDFQIISRTGSQLRIAATQTPSPAPTPVAP